MKIYQEEEDTDNAALTASTSEILGGRNAVFFGRDSL